MYCIYRITNLINGKTYIGKHLYKDLNDNYMGSGKRLGYAKKKYGIENFKKDILVFNIHRKEHASILEQTFIAAEREKVGRENCYNITDGGEGGSYKGINKGKPKSEEHKRKLAESRKGKPSPMKGKHHTEETRKQISETLKSQDCTWLKGKPKSEEHKRKIAESLKGKHHSEESKNKIRKAFKGKTRPKDVSDKIRQARKEMAEAYRKSGRKDWNTFQKEYKKNIEEK